MVEAKRPQGAYSAYGAYGLVLVLVLFIGCSYTPAGRERAHVYEMLRAIPEVTQVSVGCEGAMFATDSLCADVITKEGAELRFERVGAKSFSSSAVNVVVAEASGLVPRVASCTDVGPANFHHDAALGHHFSPTLLDIKDAVTRSGDVLEEIQYWPRCPMSWEVQDKRGVNYRYCAHKKDAPANPPKPQGCAAQ
jgi:hypothetical protein